MNAIDHFGFVFFFGVRVIIEIVNTVSVGRFTFATLFDGAVTMIEDNFARPR